MSYQEYTADSSPRVGVQAPGGVMPEGTTSYRDADGDTNAAVTLPSAIGRCNEILTITHNATADAVLQGTNKTPSTALTLSAANRVTRWISDGVTWRAVEDSKTGGNVTAVVTNVNPIAVLPVGDLFEVSMPANTDVRIRSLVNRQVYITSEGEYPGGSFTTSTAAIVNLTPTFVPADNNVHVNGELNVVRVQDILSGRLFVVTVWRLAGIAGNWSGWAEEIGVSYSGPAPAAQDFFRKAAGVVLPNGTNDYTAGVTHNGFLGIGQTIDPISPLQFGSNLRNDFIRLFSSNPNPHQFYGLGVNSNIFRYQIDTLAGSHRFYGGVSATASKQYAIIADRLIQIGDPLGPLGEGYFDIGTAGVGDNGYIRFMSPASSPGNRVQAEISFDGLSGTGGISGSSISFKTADAVAGSTLKNRMHITGAGDVVISDPSVPYAETVLGNALLTVNGSIRVKGGAMIPGNIRQPGGLTFGVSNVSTLDGSSDTDGGITSIGDGNLTFFTNGTIGGTLNNGGVWAKPGGGTWAATSDSRVKKNISRPTGTLAKLLQLSPVRFQYNGLAGTPDGGPFYEGLMAQEVQKVFPNWVTETSEKIDGTPVLQVDSSPLVYALLEAVRELKGEIDKLKGVTVAPSTLSINMDKATRLIAMDSIGLTAIGFTAPQAKTFVAGTGAIKIGISSGMAEPQVLQLLSALLTSIGVAMTLSEVMAKV